MFNMDKDEEELREILEERERAELMEVLKENLEEIRKELHTLLCRLWLIEQTFKTITEDEARGEKGT